MRNYIMLNSIQLKAIVNEEWKNIRFEKMGFNRYRMTGYVNGKKTGLGVNMPRKMKKFIEQILKGMEY